MGSIRSLIGGVCYNFLPVYMLSRNKNVVMLKIYCIKTKKNLDYIFVCVTRV